MTDNKKDKKEMNCTKPYGALSMICVAVLSDGVSRAMYLEIMFYRYISKNLTNYINADEIVAGNADFDYPLLSDENAKDAKDDLVATKGFFILPSEIIVNMSKNAHIKVLSHIENSEKARQVRLVCLKSQERILIKSCLPFLALEAETE